MLILFLADVASVKTRQASSWDDSSSPHIRTTSTTALRIPSTPFLPPEAHIPSSQKHTKHISTIQLQELSPNGIQPPPPVVDSWTRIDNWAEHHYPELYDSLSYPATEQDVDDLEAELDVQLPMDVRQSLYVHDGQERGGRPTGILFGVTLLDCEEIVEEWTLWKTVAQAYAHETLSLDIPSPLYTPSTRSSISTTLSPSLPSPLSDVPLASPSSSTALDAAPSPSTSSITTIKPSANRRQSKLFGQTQRFAASRPPDTIRKVYAHPSWIPLAKDFSGNNIAVDLCPGPRGTYGQIILFGRDCDTKYVVARSWASFLAAVADDFEAGEARFEGGAAWGEGEGDMERDGGVDMRGAELRIRKCQGARDGTFMEVLKARVRLREREIRRKRESQLAPKQNGDGNANTNLTSGVNGIGNGKRGSVGGRSPTLDLMANSPILNGDGIPSPNLPRENGASPVLGTPVVTTPISRTNSITVSGPEILAQEQQAAKAKGPRIVSGGVVIAEEEAREIVASPISIKSPVLTERKHQHNVLGTVMEEKAATGLGIEDITTGEE